MSDEPTEWTVTLEAVAGSDDLLLPIPPVLMARMGWQEGDRLEFVVHDCRAAPYVELRKVG